MTKLERLLERKQKLEEFIRQKHASLARLDLQIEIERATPPRPPHSMYTGRPLPNLTFEELGQFDHERLLLEIFRWVSYNKLETIVIPAISQATNNKWQEELEAALLILPPSRRFVVEARARGKTYTEIGKLVGWSSSVRPRQLASSAYRKIHFRLRNSELDKAISSCWESFQNERQH